MNRGSLGLRSGFGKTLRNGVLGLLVVTLLGAGHGATAQAGYAAIVIDATNGNVLYQRDVDGQHYPASLTKMMTLYLVFEALEAGRITMDTAWTMSAHAAAQPPTKLGLAVGETIKVRDAILALITKSANDVAAMTGESLSGSESQFAKDMTAKAHELGMRNTVFANASGLPDNRMVTTARDMSVLALRIQADFPQYYPLFATRSFSYRGQTYGNHNKLLGSVDGVDGIKTGFTNAAGWNLAASALRDGRRIVAVILGGQSRVWRDNRMRELLGDGFVLAAELDTPAPLPGVHPLRGDGLQMVASADTVTAAPQADTQPAEVALTLTNFDNLAQGNVDDSLVTAQGSAEDLPWAVQVGAFSHFENAYKALDDAGVVIAQVIGAQGSSVVTAADNDGSPLYRARFVNLSEAQAREGCKLLAARDMSCAVVRYSAGS